MVYWAFGGRRLAMGSDGNLAAFVSVVERAALAVADEDGLETMTVRLRDLQATAAIALLVMSGNVQMAGAQTATAAGQGSTTATAAVGNSAAPRRATRRRR